MIAACSGERPISAVVDLRARPGTDEVRRTIPMPSTFCMISFTAFSLTAASVLALDATDIASAGSPARDTGKRRARQTHAVSRQWRQTKNSCLPTTESLRSLQAGAQTSKHSQMSSVFPCTSGLSISPVPALYPWSRRFFLRSCEQAGGHVTGYSPRAPHSACADWANAAP